MRISITASLGTIVLLVASITAFAEGRPPSLEGQSEPKVVHKMLVIGNSITRHGPSDKLGWHGDWGMAATAREKDFAHVLYDGM